MYGACPPKAAGKKDSVISGKACIRKENDIGSK